LGLTVVVAMLFGTGSSCLYQAVCDGVSLLDAGMGLASALVRYSSLLERLESPVNLAAVSGGIATLSTYMAASISDSPG